MKSETVNNEAQVCYQGFFWVIAKSFEDILNGNYKILAEKFVAEAIRNTDTKPENWYGVRFEDLLSTLPERIAGK